ncbi:MAG TPA: DEAD/DEAH box helicase, partial [Patescibacteria group bacterium]|nr:DEAD/DEAH box helicase [Patescibacteria group bacterium]
METAQKKHVSTSQNILFGAPEGQDARILADRARAMMHEDRVLVHVASDDERAAVLQELLSFFAPDVKVLVFPAWDCLPYDRVSPHGDIAAQRVAALSTLLKWEAEQQRYPRILLTTAAAAVQRVMPRESLQNAVMHVKKGGRLDMKNLQKFLHANGYLRTDTVREAGEYAIRGGIADLFPPGFETPVRLDLFGDEVESIRSFDPSTQLTEKDLPELSLYPAVEFFIDEPSINRFRTRYRALFGVAQADDPLYEAVSAGRRHSGMEHWQPLFFEKMDTLLDYMPKAAVTLDHHADQSREERSTQIRDFYEARRTLEKAGKKKKSTDVSLSGAAYHPLPPELLYISEGEWRDTAGNAETLSPFGGSEGQADGGGKKGRDFADLRAQPDADMFNAVGEYVAVQRAGQRKIMIAAYSEGSRERLRGMMEHAGFANFKTVDNAEDLKRLEPYETGMAVLALGHGFIAPDLAVLTEQDILGDKLARRSAKRKRADNFLTEVSSLSPGDLVVHLDHGIGRFEGLETIVAARTLHDCLKLTYANDDRLFVPVENIEVLSRFGSDEGTVQLDKLGGAGWQARKARVKKDLMIMADGLLKIAAERALKKGEPMATPESYQEFASRFPWQETDDQLRSIGDVLKDMGSGQPMDRLVCGDVGFGKTEVALRAAYVAAIDGAQVAVAVPTTLLARQHYQNFAERFRGTGLRVEQLSRLVSAKDVKRAKEGLSDGTVNIVIGTHALFGKDVKFAHLGLMIVDEEQRFGVKQKERLKELKANVHVLTLTATPIPRTLQMALAGVRDMSLIATPPVDRLAIRTFILPFDPVVVRDALLREHYRGGQSFYVVPRIGDMQEVEEMLKELVPEVKIIAAHGQMSATDLEDRMSAFYEGKYDVLLATNIIESGLDIPRANTMVVHRADMFG